MRNVLFIVPFVLAFLVFCLPVHVFAGNLPVKSMIYAQASGENAQTYKPVNIFPISNNIYALTPEEDLTLCTYLRLYFVFDGVDNVQSFHLRMWRYTGSYQDASTALNGLAINVGHFENGTFSNSTSIRTLTTTTRTVDGDRTYYEWTFTSSTAYQDCNSFYCSIPFQSFMWGPSTRILFYVDELTFNGASIEDIEAQKMADKFEEYFNKFDNIENQITTNIPVNDIREYLQNDDGDNYFSSFQYLIGSSNLLSSLIAIVASIGIIGFIIYGKKV